MKTYKVTADYRVTKLYYVEDLIVAESESDAEMMFQDQVEGMTVTELEAEYDGSIEEKEGSELVCEEI